MTDHPKDGHVAVIDIGKTNAKLALVRLSDLSEVAVVTRPNTVLPGPPYPHFDIDGHWAFILDGLARFHANHRVQAISVTTHGAAGALIAKDGSLAAPVLDYEHTGPEDLAKAYDAIRPSFAETGSPRLSMGLNLGAQLHWQIETHPKLLGTVETVVTYPQFWGHRLTGVAATDVTSLGCHTDLWNPYARAFSSLPNALGLSGKIASPRKPGEILGPILKEVARRTGLDPKTPVYCGIHDSNASLLPHLITRKPPFSVVSTGTWVIAMGIGGTSVTLDATRDTLVNVNAIGDAVPSARFMGGREHDIALAQKQVTSEDADIKNVLTDEVMLMPAVVLETGPFGGCRHRWIGKEPPIGSGVRSAAVSFYLAMVTSRCLELIGHQGDVIVEGPFARNQAFLRMLEAASSARICPIESSTGTSAGAAMLVSGGSIAKDALLAAALPDEQLGALLASYAQAWRAQQSQWA